MKESKCFGCGAVIDDHSTFSEGNITWCVHCGHEVGREELKSPRRVKLSAWAGKSFFVALAFVIGAILGVSMTAITLKLETASLLNKTSLDSYHLGRAYERSIWQRFGNYAEK